MDPSSNSSHALAMVPYSGNSQTEFVMEDFTDQCHSFSVGDWVKLFVPACGEVRIGTVKVVRPEGQWRGVPLPVQPWVYLLVVPHSIKREFFNVCCLPPQTGVRNLYDAQDEIVLWRVADVVRTSGDPPMDPLPYIRQGAWFGHDVHRMDASDLLLSAGRIMCWRPEDHFQDETLGEDCIGVTVLDVFVGSTEDIITHARWPLSDCWFPSGRSLRERVDHFTAFPDKEDPLAYLGGRMKAPYRFIVRKPSVVQKQILYDRKTRDKEIRKVSSEKCCSRLCCQHFSQYHTLLVRQKYFLKSFEERRAFGIAVSGQFHSLSRDPKEKYITVEGTDVCSTAWYKIHGVPKSTFHSYMQIYSDGIVSGTHGNKGIKRPWARTVLVTGTMTAIVEENADQMPHQMRGIGNGRVDTLKYLSVGRNWKRVRLDANKLNANYGLPPVSQSTISRLKKEHFINVAIKLVGSSFAKCTQCDQLQEFILKSPKGSPEYVEFVKQRT